jgi:hypothetical protein
VATAIEPLLTIGLGEVYELAVRGGAGGSVARGTPPP